MTRRARVYAAEQVGRPRPPPMPQSQSLVRCLFAERLPTRAVLCDNNDKCQVCVSLHRPASHRIRSARSSARRRPGKAMAVFGTMD